MTSRYSKPLKRELGRYLPEGVRPLVGATFECEFECDTDFETIAEKLAVMPDITWSWGKVDGARCLVGMSKGRQISFEIYEGCALPRDGAGLGLERGLLQPLSSRGVPALGSRKIDAPPPDVSSQALRT